MAKSFRDIMAENMGALQASQTAPETTARSIMQQNMNAGAQAGQGTPAFQGNVPYAEGLLPQAPQPSEAPAVGLEEQDLNVLDSSPIPTGVGVGPGAQGSSSNAVASGMQAHGSAGTPDTGDENGDLMSRYENLLKARSEGMEKGYGYNFAQDALSAINSNAGLLAAGMAGRHGNTVSAPQMAQLKQRDIAAQVDTQTKPGLESLMERYKLLQQNERAKASQDATNAYRQAMLGMQAAQLEAQRGAGKFDTEGEQATDRDFGKRFNEWEGGGRSAVESNLRKLQDARQSLEKRNDIIPARIKGALPDWLQSETDRQTRDSIRSAAQESLRAVLGSQFTEREGEAIMNRAYDPTLSPEANMKRVDAIIRELSEKKGNMDTRAQYFGNRGTLKGLGSLSGRGNVADSNPKSGPLGETTTRNGKTYKWNPATGKYQPIE